MLDPITAFAAGQKNDSVFSIYFFKPFEDVGEGAPGHAVDGAGHEHVLGILLPDVLGDLADAFALAEVVLDLGREQIVVVRAQLVAQFLQLLRELIDVSFESALARIAIRGRRIRSRRPVWPSDILGAGTDFDCGQSS